MSAKFLVAILFFDVEHVTHISHCEALKSNRFEDSRRRKKQRKRKRDQRNTHKILSEKRKYKKQNKNHLAQISHYFMFYSHKLQPLCIGALCGCALLLFHCVCHVKRMARFIWPEQSENNFWRLISRIKWKTWTSVLLVHSTLFIASNWRWFIRSFIFHPFSSAHTH